MEGTRFIEGARHPYKMDRAQKAHSYAHMPLGGRGIHTRWTAPTSSNKSWNDVITRMEQHVATRTKEVASRWVWERGGAAAQVTRLDLRRCRNMDGAARIPGVLRASGVRGSVFLVHGMVIVSRR